MWLKEISMWLYSMYECLMYDQWTSGNDELLMYDQWEHVRSVGTSGYLGAYLIGSHWLGGRDIKLPQSGISTPHIFSLLLSIMKRNHVPSIST